MNNAQKAAIAVAAVATPLVIYFGFSTEQHIVDHCTAITSIHMEANYSETTLERDFEGNLIPETDYWDEVVSDKYYVEQYNLDVVDSNVDPVIKGIVAYPPENFPYLTGASFHPDFDNFRKVQTAKLRQHFDNGDTITINHNSYSTCYHSIGQPATVKYWYGISYGVGA